HRCPDGVSHHRRFLGIPATLPRIVNGQRCNGWEENRPCLEHLKQYRQGYVAPNRCCIVFYWLAELTAIAIVVHRGSKCPSRCALYLSLQKLLRHSPQRLKCRPC